MSIKKIHLAVNHNLLIFVESKNDFCLAIENTKGRFEVKDYNSMTGN